jgi:hypothetical protein
VKWAEAHWQSSASPLQHVSCDSSKRVLAVSSFDHDDPCSPGGERILTVFETRLTQSIKSLDFTKMLESSNVSPIWASSVLYMWALQQTGGCVLASMPCC